MATIELLPKPTTTKAIIKESKDVKSLVLEMNDGQNMHVRPGQFVEVSVQGYGEATFAVTRTSEDKKEFIISVKRIGYLSKIMHRTAEGDVLGVRGRYGNSFPVRIWK
jgi:sulfhydrogenase subunit gamma (sulfur reductase)